MLFDRAASNSRGICLLGMVPRRTQPWATDGYLRSIARARAEYPPKREMICSTCIRDIYAWRVRLSTWNA